MNQSVLKALDILNLFNDRTIELSLGDISKKLDMPKPTAYRLLQSLEQKGYVKKEKRSEYDTRYRLGLKLLELGNLVAEQLELGPIALPHMKKLCERINEAVHLVIREKFEAIYIEKVEGHHALRLVTRVGKREPLHVGSGPKLLLANQSEAFIADYINHIDFSLMTERGVLNKRELMAEILDIQTNGYAVSRGEQDPETIGVSYPIKDHRGRVVAALAVSGPAIRFFGDRGRQIQEDTAETARFISKDLGYTCGCM
ncbi:IclR family transcriptional regulator [Camelliibacillus cellulosilyticus]|uniref:IclR family transcriptional regulator n=1 Tax=Camelliibacillus cellulosilyticus TaxID=2174486 RepID=A0ABV9GGR8_9BACL